MHDMPPVPDRVKAVVEEYCRRRCADAEREAYARGVAAGREETLAVLKAVAAFQPNVFAPVSTGQLQQPRGVGQDANAPVSATPLPMPVAAQPVATPVVAVDVKKAEPITAPIPETMLSVVRPAAAVANDEDQLGTAGFRDALDDLFGDERWGDLDRQELVRYVMLLVQEELAERGVDPSPVLSMVRTLGECGGGEPFEATLLSLTDPTLLSWQAVPLRNPRGNFRFAAENLETGQKRYGEKAIAHMQHANKDRHEFKDGDKQPYDLAGERTLAEHTEAFRRAKDSLSELVTSLRAGESVRPGDLADFQDRIGLLSVADLRVLQGQLEKSLTGRVRGGQTKADRVAAVRQSLARLVEAATAITKAALDHAEMSGLPVHVPDEEMETLLEGEIEVGPALLSVAAADGPLAAVAAVSTNDDADNDQDNDQDDLEDIDAEILRLWGGDVPDGVSDPALLSVGSQKRSGGHTPPAGVVAAAKRILKLREENGDEVKGGTAVGWGRARQLADGGPVSAAVVLRMANFFSRHAKNFAVAPEHKGEPWKDRGWTAFMLWGGAPGRAWSTALAKRLRGADLSVPAPATAQPAGRRPIRILPRA